MSAPHPALTSDELEALNSASTVRTYLLVTPVTTPFATARVASTPTFPASDIAVSGTSADWLNCRFGMTVWFGSSAGAKDKGVYYLRTVPTSGLAKIGEVGRPDAGAETLIERSASIVSGDYITVFETFNLHAGRSKIAYSYGTTAGTFLKFTDRAYNDENTKPPPYWQGDNWKAIRLPTGDSTISSSFSLTAVPFLGTQSVASYAWTVPAAFTSVSDAGTATVTFDAPNGFWVLYCQAVLDDGSAATAIRYLWVYGDTGDVVPIEISDISDNRDRASRKATLTLADDVRGQIDSTGAVMVIDERTYADGTVDTATVQFCGWLGTGSGSIEYAQRGATIEVLGPGAILATLGADSQRLEQIASPTNWQQAPYGLMTASYFAYYLLEFGVVNYTDLFGYYPLDSAIPQSINPWDAQKGTYLGQIQAIAQRCQFANIGADSDGDLHFYADAPFIAPADRGSLVDRLLLTADIYSNVSFDENTHPRNRLIVTSAFIYDGTTMQGVRSIAPSKAAGQATGEEEPSGIIVASQDQNDLAAGLYYSWGNATYESITFTLPGNWDVIETAHMQRVTYAIDAQYSPTGEEISGSGIPETVVKRRNSDGASYIELTVRPETTGTAGEPFPYPPETAPVFGDVGLISFVSTIPALAGTYGHETNFDPTTAATGQIKFMLLAQKSDKSEWAVIRVNAIGTLSASDISPTSGQRFDLGAPIKLIPSPTLPKGLILLCENGIAFTSNSAAKTVTWAITGGEACNIEIAMITGTMNKTGCHYRMTSADSGGNQVVEFENVDTGVNFDYANLDIHGAVFDHSTYYNGTGDPHIDAGIFTPLYRLYLERNGATSFVIDFDILDSSVNIADIAGTPAGPGVFYWLSKAPVSGTDYVFCNYTYNSFASFNSTQVAKYSVAMTYAVQASRYNKNYVWVTAGKDGDDAAVYFSSNGAVSFTAGATLTTRGGAFSLPRALPVGGANKQSKNILYVNGVGSGNLQATRDGSTTATVAAGATDYPATNDVLAQSPINGNWAAMTLKSGDTYTSHDGGKTWAFVGTVPGSGNVNSLKQWPNNHKYFLAGGVASLAYCVDAGITWTDLYSDFTAWSDVQYGSGVITEIVTALLAEWIVFKKVVL